jgi:putative spermidine/putrescine transport system ATP-binding protein
VPNSGAADGLEIVGLTKTYGHFRALDVVSLSIRRREFVTLLGPSGSGKTTLLLSIAGFVHPDGGDLKLDGRSIVHLPPEKRDFGMVYQGYALFPHMTVSENVAFPLKVRGQSKGEIHRKVHEALDRVQLSARANHRPAQLSGGQQQRVALARALVFTPHLLLLDEPLSALDKKLRDEMQSELKRLHREVGLTFIYVTHDQDEALSMSDRIAVMREGRLVQFGTPTELYRRPATVFVADFLGKSNFLRGVVETRTETGFVLARGDAKIHVDQRLGRVPAAGANVVVALRPEAIGIAPNAGSGNTLRGTVQDVSYVGTSFRLLVDTRDFGPLALVVPAGPSGVPQIGGAIELGWGPDAGMVVSEDQTTQPAGDSR